MNLTRKCGILMPVASLSGSYGIGTLGKPSHAFLDFLKKAGQHVWQILPLAQTGYGDSPYQSCSAFAGNPYFIDLDLLAADGLLEKKDYENIDFGARPDEVDYATLYTTRYGVLRKAFEKFAAWFPDEYYAFCFEQGAWLEDYALYMTAKGLCDGKNYQEWPEDLRMHRREAIDQLYTQHESEVHFWKFCQYEFSKQWTAVRAYAKECEVEILGDIPIYMAADSADVWASPELFLLDEKGLPRAVAGCPPDAFSASGQLWGNPLYNWGYHQSTQYAWWIRRIKHAMTQFDVVRIDHFRAFDTYYSIPYGSQDACGGEWKNGPGMTIFEAIRAALGDVPIIAEDLGELFDSVRTLLKDTKLPGMKVLQFAFGTDGTNEYLPHNHPVQSVVYTGTHDNATSAQWLKTATPNERKMARAYLGLNENEGEVNGMIRGALSSVAALCIIPMGDWLCLDEIGRINTPSTLGGRNWVWRAKESDFSATFARHIATICTRYAR